MAAPVAAKAAVVVAKSKTGRRIVLGVLVILLAILLSPIVMVYSAAAMFSTAWEQDRITVTNVEVIGGWANPLGATHGWTTYPNHSGGAMDIPVASGTPVYAPAAGKVVDLSEGCGGRVLGIQHTDKIVTVFAHLASFRVTPGTSVQAGQLIATSGASGYCASGAHLHFEVRTAGPYVWGSFAPAYAFMKRNGIEMGTCLAGCALYPLQ